MAELMNQFQDRVKTSLSHIVLIVLKLVTGLVIGLTFGLVGQELIGYGNLSLILVMVVIAASIMRILKFWSWGRVLAFDLICVLVALLLRMYILIAPGA